MSLCISSCSGKNCKNSHLGGHNVSASGVSAASVLLGKPATTRGVLGVGIQGTPFQKLKSLRIWPTFSRVATFCALKIQCLTWEGQGQAWIIFYWGNCSVTFKGQNPGGESFPTFPSGGYAHGSGNYVLSSIQNHLFSSILLYIWMKTWVTWPATSHSNACSMCL